MRVAVRWIRADLRSRRLQALLAINVIAGVVIALIVGVTLLEGTMNPWRGIFTRSNGAHVWIHTRPGTDLQPLARLEGVTAIAGPYQTAAATVVRNGRRSHLELRAMGPELPAVARPLLADGRWLSPSVPDGVVLEQSFAGYLGIRVGDSLTIESLDGATRPLLVAGIADTADQVPYPDSGQGLVWSLQSVLTAIQPMPEKTQQLVGLRSSDSAMADFIAQRAATAIPEKQLQSMSTWRDVREKMELDDRLLGSFLALFGIVGLVAAALAIGNTMGGWVLGRMRDIALLKTLGLTPAQIMRILLMEQSFIGLIGIVLGVLGARLATSSRLSPLWPDSLATKTATPIPSGRIWMIAGGVAGVLLLAMVVPAWRGSRTSPLAMVGISPPSGHLSRLARLALLVRFPPALVLGVRDAFTRRARAVLTIVGLAVPMFMATIALGCLATLNFFEHHPERVGFSGAMTIRATGMTDDQATKLINSDHDVAGSYPGGYTEALLPGQTRTVRLRAVGMSINPYPYAVAEGRLHRAAGEAVAGQGLLNTLRARVGERIRLKIGARPVVLHIVGRTIEPERNGEVLSVGLDTLEDIPEAAAPQFIAAVLRPGADPETVRNRLLESSGRRLDVQVVPNAADQLAIVRTLIPALLALLALTGLANLLTATSVGLHDHVRDLSVLRAVGLTPRQAGATMVAGTTLLALLAMIAGAVLGTVLAPWLIDLQGEGSGVGSGIGRPPAAATLLGVIVIALVMTALTAFLPARRAARIAVAVALHDRLTTSERPARRPVTALQRAEPQPAGGYAET